MGMKYELVLRILVGDFNLGIWVTLGFDFDFFKFGVIYDLGLERQRQRNKREHEFVIQKEHW